MFGTVPLKTVRTLQLELGASTLQLGKKVSAARIQKLIGNLALRYWASQAAHVSEKRQIVAERKASSEYVTKDEHLSICRGHDPLVQYYCKLTDLPLIFGADSQLLNM